MARNASIRYIPQSAHVAHRGNMHAHLGIGKSLLETISTILLAPVHAVHHAYRGMLHAHYIVCVLTFLATLHLC